MLNLLKILYGKYKTWYLRTLPYRQYIFEVKLKNIDTIAECKSYYLLSISYNTLIEELHNIGHIEIDNKQYLTSDIEYTKLIKTIPYYLYNFETFSDFPPNHFKTLKGLIKRQRKYIKYAKYLTPQELKKIINDSKNYYV